MKVSRLPSKSKFTQYSDKGTEDLDHWRRVFVDIADPTEYEAALQLAGSWAEWQRMKKEWPEFRDKILIDWLAEVEVKLRSEAIRQVCIHSRADSGAAAAKWVAEGKYKPRRAGNPSKAEVQKQAKIQARIDDEVQDDIARVLNTEGLKLVEVN